MRAIRVMRSSHRGPLLSDRLCSELQGKPGAAACPQRRPGNLRPKPQRPKCADYREQAKAPLSAGDCGADV